MHRRILKDFTISEISAVDFPAQEGARALLMKAAPMKSEGGKEFPASDYAYVPTPYKPSTWKLRLTSVPGGKPDPAIVGAAAAALGPGFRGNKVDIPSADRAKVVARVRAAWHEANPDKPDSDMPAALKKRADDPTDQAAKRVEGDDPMPKTAEELAKALDDQTAELEKAEKAKTDAEAALAKANEERDLAKAEAGLSDAERAVFKSLDGDEATAFLKASKEERAAEIAKRNDADPVVYKADDGTEFRKSHDPMLVKMARERDEDRRELAKQRKENEDAAIEKRAAEEFPKFEKAGATALVRAVRGIKDDEARKAAEGALKAGHAALSKAFETVGHRGGESDPAVAKARGDFQSKVQEIRKRDKCSAQDAMQKARSEHPDLFKAFQGEAAGEAS